MACIYGFYGTIYGILGAMYGSTLMWCHLWCHIWCGTCEIRKDTHVTTIYGTMYELKLVKYGRTHISSPYMAPCMKWNLWNMEGRTCNFHTWHHVWIGICDIPKDAHVTSIYGTMYEFELAKYGTTQMSFPYMAPCIKWNLWTMEGRRSNFHIWHHVWSGTSAAFLPNGAHRQF